MGREDGVRETRYCQGEILKGREVRGNLRGRQIGFLRDFRRKWWFLEGFGGHLCKEHNCVYESDFREKIWCLSAQQQDE